MTNFKMIMFIALVSTTVSTRPASAQTDASGANDRSWYLSGSLGAALPGEPDLASGDDRFRLELTDGTLPALSLGLRTRHRGRYPLRLETEALGVRHDIDDFAGTAIVIDGQSELSFRALMLNALLDFRSGAPISPYLGAGVGMGILDFDTVQTSESDDSVWAFQLQAGVAFRADWMGAGSLLLGSRFLAAENSLHAFGRAKDYRLMSIHLGFRYEFR